MSDRSNWTAALCGMVSLALVAPAMAADEIDKLGPPRRNVVSQPRPVQQLAQQLASGQPGVSGVIPLMIFPSNALIVENSFALVRTPAACTTVLAAYDQRLRAKYGNKVKHGLYCVTIGDGSAKSIATVAKSF